MPRVRPCGPLCGLVGAREGKDSAPRDFKRVLGRFSGAPKSGQEKAFGALLLPLAPYSSRSADCHGGLRHFEIDADHAETNMLWRYFL